MQKGMILKLMVRDGGCCFDDVNFSFSFSFFGNWGLGVAF